MLAAAAGLRASAEGLIEGAAGSLRLGYSGAVSIGALTEVLDRFRGDSPGVAVTLRQASHGSLLNNVVDRSLDAAFVRYIRDDPRLTTIELRQEPTVVAVYGTHPFFGRDSLGFAELSGQPLIMLAREVDPDVHAHATSLFEQAGFTPCVVHRADSVQTSLAMVAGRLGVAVVTAAAAAVVPTGVRCIPLADPSYVSVWLVHRAGDSGPALARLVAGLPTEPVTGGRG